jgi:predicted dinucleotide-binding enzyme
VFGAEGGAVDTTGMGRCGVEGTLLLGHAIPPSDVVISRKRPAGVSEIIGDRVRAAEVSDALASDVVVLARPIGISEGAGPCQVVLVFVGVWVR